MRYTFLIAAISLLRLTCSANGDEHGTGISLHPPAELKWHEGPASLPKGAKIAVMEGDPSMEGPFVFRVKVPDGYRIPPHTHEKALRPMPTGTYGFWEAGMKHFVAIKGDTVVQFHGLGPWTIQYVNPADEPRNQLK